MILYHQNNIHYDMILVIWFVVTENLTDDVNIESVVEQHDMSNVHGDSDSIFLIVLSYNINCVYVCLYI